MKNRRTLKAELTVAAAAASLLRSKKKMVFKGAKNIGYPGGEKTVIVVDNQPFTVIVPAAGGQLLLIDQHGELMRRSASARSLLIQLGFRIKRTKGKDHDR